jgi:hypothetical protein
VAAHRRLRPPSDLRPAAPLRARRRTFLQRLKAKLEAGDVGLGDLLGLGGGGGGAAGGALPAVLQRLLQGSGKLAQVRGVPLGASCAGCIWGCHGWGKLFATSSARRTAPAL